MFFDPDNWLEIRSRARGRKNSCKHLYRDEVCATFRAGSSVLIYQHFARERRDEYTDTIARELSSRTGAATVFLFSTPHVLFILAAQAEQMEFLRKRLPGIKLEWVTHITVREHRPDFRG